jgi:hypothetical protein
VLCGVRKFSGHCVFSIHFAPAVFDVPIIIADCNFSTYTSLWASLSSQLCVCVCVCVCAHAHVHVLACMCVHACLWSRVHPHACLCTGCLYTINQLSVHFGLTVHRAHTFYLHKLLCSTLITLVFHLLFITCLWVCDTDSEKTDSYLTLLNGRLLLTNFCPCYILSGRSHSFPENVPQQQRVRQQRSVCDSYGLPSSMPHGEHSSKDSRYMCQVCLFNYILIILPYISSSK